MFIKYTLRSGTARTLTVRGEKIHGAGLHWDVPEHLEDEFLQIPSVQKLIATGSLTRELAAISDDAAGAAQPSPAASPELSNDDEPDEDEELDDEPEVNIEDHDEVPEFITKKAFVDLAEASGISKSAARTAVDDLPGVKREGNRISIPTASANAWINDHLDNRDEE